MGELDILDFNECVPVKCQCGERHLVEVPADCHLITDDMSEQGWCLCYWTCFKCANVNQIIMDRLENGQCPQKP